MTKFCYNLFVDKYVTVYTLWNSKDTFSKISLSLLWNVLIDLRETGIAFVDSNECIRLYRVSNQHIDKMSLVKNKRIR